MRKIKHLTTRLKNLCRNGAALWFSSGKDSRLLLEVCLRENLNVTILCFDETWNKNQRHFLTELAKTQKIFSYPPRDAVMVGEGNQIGAISHYAVGSKGETIPLICDFIDGDETRCALQFKIKTSSNLLPPVFFKTHICGAKRADRHFVFGHKEFIQERFAVGDANFFCPLFNWTDKEVIEALKVFGIDWQESESLNTGNVLMCRKCLIERGEVLCPQTKQMVSAHDWQPERNLANWRELNGVKL